MNHPLTRENEKKIYSLLDECVNKLREVSRLHPALSSIHHNDETIEAIREDAAVLAARTAGDRSFTLPEPSNGEPQQYAISTHRMAWADKLIG